MYSLITCENLTKLYPGIIALNQLNLTLEHGRVIGLLGPNGSGKSTLIKLIAGLLTPNSGNIYINGQKPGVESKLAVAYLPDCIALPDYMNIRQLVDFYADFYSNFSRDRAYAMLQGLQLDVGHNFKSLSKGTKEKVQLVLTMSREADLYLLDEPIGGVDPAARDYILNTIMSNRPPQAGILISTHLITDIEPILDEVVVINQGNLQLHSSVDSLRDSYHNSIDGYFREVFRC